MAESNPVPFPWNIITTKNGLDAVRKNKRAFIRTWIIASAVLGITLCTCSGSGRSERLIFLLSLVPFGLSIIWCLLDLFYPCIFSGDEMHPAIMLAGECNVTFILFLWSLFWLGSLFDRMVRYGNPLVGIYATVPQLASILLHLYLVIKLACVVLPRVFPIPDPEISITCPACQHEWTQRRQGRREANAGDEDLIAPLLHNEATGSGENTPRSTHDQSEHDAGDLV